MTFPNLQAALGAPWALDASGMTGLRALLAVARQPMAPLQALMEEQGPRVGTQPRNGRGVAVLPIRGFLLNRCTAIEEWFGFASCERIGAWLDAFLADDGVTAIVLQLDSPGGSVLGIEELARKILAGREVKPITAMVDPMACSAAYWLAAAATEVVVSPSSLSANIGILMVREDTTGADAEAGVVYHAITSGEFKGEGLPCLPMTDEERAALQALCDTYYGLFTATVAKGRGVSPAAVRSGFGQGRAVAASDAVALGVANRIGTMDAVLAKLTKRRGGGATAAALPLWSDGLEEVPGEPVGFTAHLEQVLAKLPPLMAGALTAGPARGHGTAAPELVPVPEPAPVAKESPMTAPVAAAPGNGAENEELARARAESVRVTELTALAKQHPDYAPKLGAWIAGATTPQAARDEILADMRAKLERGPQIRVGEPNEGKRPWGNAEYHALLARQQAGEIRSSHPSFRRAHDDAFGEFLLAVGAAYSPGGSVDPRLQVQAAANGLSQGVPSEGGYGVLPQFSNVIWEGLRSDPNSLLAMTDQYTVNGESLTFPANAETSRATGSRFGGVQGYWINEADQITKSKPKLRQVKLEPQEMAVLVYLTDKLVRNNAVGLGQFVNRAATEEITFMVGDGIVNGDGVGKPKGLLAAGSLISITKETSQVAATFNKKNANKMWARLHPRSRAGAVWLVNVDVEPQFDEFYTEVKNVAGSENVGGFGSMIYNAEKNTLKGRPIVYCEFCATLGTVGDVILWDPKTYATGVRGDGVREDVSMHVRFEYAEQAFRFMYEVDGQPWLASALTPYKGSNTLSGHVAVQTRS